MTRYRSGYWRCGGKAYGWAFGIPGVLVVEIWHPAGARRVSLPWENED